MKELNRFRQFLNEDQMKNLAKLLRDEADQPDNKVGKSIFLKYAKKAEDTDVKDIKPLLKKLEDELIDKHPDTFSGEDDIVGSFLSTSKNYKKRTKENVNELFGRKQDPIEKQASMVFSTIEFMDDLVSAGHMDKAFFDVFTEKIGEAYSSLMMGASPELQSKMGFEVDVDLDENDNALDEVINEAKPNLKKSLPTIAARNVERNNLINADIEDMMDMIGGAGKGEDSKEAKILFKASNASDELEGALTDLQIHFEDDLGEGKEEIDEVKDAKFKVGDKVTMKAGGKEMEIVGARRMFGSPTQAYKVKKSDGKEVEYSANQLKKA